MPDDYWNEPRFHPEHIDDNLHASSPAVVQVSPAQSPFDVLAAMVQWYGKRGGENDDLLPPDEQNEPIAQAMRFVQSALENGPAGLADATSNPPLSDLSSLRKGAEVAVKDAARDLLSHLELYDFIERDPSGELNEKMADLKAALVSGREDGDG